MRVISSEDDSGAQEIEDDAESAAHEEPAGGPPEKASWTRRIPPEVPVFLFYLLAAAFLTWPIAAHFSRTVYGFPSDNLGQLWTWWWFKNASSFGATASFSPLIGFPFGQHLPMLTAEFITQYGARFLLLFTTQTVVYNLFVTSSFFLSGVTMYYLVRYISADRVVAFFGGFAFLLSAYHALHATFSVNLAITQWMPLFILVLLVFMKRPSPINAVLLFASGILVLGTSVHYGFFMAVFTPSFLLAYFVYRRLRARRLAIDGGAAAVKPPAVNKRTVALALVIVLAIALIAFPLFYASEHTLGQAGKWPTRATPGGVRNISTSAAGSASPLSYVLPEKENRFLGWVTRGLAPSRVSFYNNSLYLGLAILAPAIFAMVLIFRRRREDDPGAGPPGGAPEKKRAAPRIDPPEGDRALAWGFLFAAAVAFVLSMPPYVRIGSTRVPLPSTVLQYIVPWLRWYMRFGAVVIICFILLACLGLAWLRRERGRRWTLALVAILSVFLFFEMIIVPPFKYFKVGEEPPGVFASVTSMSFPGGMVIYPAFEPGFFNSQYYMYYQQTFKKPMLNGGFDNSDGEALRRTVYNPFNPQTPGILRRMGIDHVVYLDKMFEQYEGTEKAETEVTFLPPGLQLETRVKSDDIFASGYVYKVTAPEADLAPIYQGDITVPHIDKGRVTVRLVQQDGIIRIVNFTGKPVKANLKLPVGNLAFDHNVALTQYGKVLWQGKLTDNESTVIEVSDLSVPAGGTVLHLVAGGRPFVLSDDQSGVFGTDDATLKIGDVSVQPAQK